MEDAELLFTGHRVSDLHDEKVLEIGCMTVWTYLTLLNFTMVKTVSFMLRGFLDHNTKKNHKNVTSPRAVVQTQSVHMYRTLAGRGIMFYNRNMPFLSMN